MAKALTPEQAKAVQEVYAGAQGAGSRIAGISEVEVSDVLSGSKDAPVVIGQRVLVTVRVAEGGCLLPRRENAGPKDPPAVSLLRIDSYPDVMFEPDGTPHLVWVAFARIIDVGTQRVIDTARSGPTTEESAAMQGGRPYEEYMNDPEYREASISAEAASREEAVRQAMSRIEVGKECRPNRKKVVAAAVGVGVAVVVAGVVGIALATSGDDEPSAAQGPAVTGSASPSASPTPSPTPSPTVEVTTLSQEIGLVPGGELGGSATFTAGACGGSDFGSEVTMKDDGGGRLRLEQQQPLGGGQVTKGGELSDGKTLVFIDDEAGYDEMYVLQAGPGNSLKGFNLYGPDGALPDQDELPEVDRLLTTDAPRKWTGPALSARVGDTSVEVCDLGVTMQLDLVE